MRKFAIVLMCAALLPVAAAGSHNYRVEFRFANHDADLFSFARDRRQCLEATSTVYQSKQERAGGEIGVGIGGPRNAPLTVILPLKSYKRDAMAFYQCMTAKGYRADPNGAFAVAISAQI